MGVGRDVTPGAKKQQRKVTPTPAARARMAGRVARDVTVPASEKKGVSATALRAQKTKARKTIRAGVKATRVEQRSQRKQAMQRAKNFANVKVGSKIAHSFTISGGGRSVSMTQGQKVTKSMHQKVARLGSHIAKGHKAAGKKARTKAGFKRRKKTT